MPWLWLWEPVVLEPVRPLVRPDDPPARPDPVLELPVRPLSPVRDESWERTGRDEVLLDP
jgi:hypothetical protein